MSPFMSRARRGLLSVMGGLAVLMATAAHAGSVTYVYTDPQGTPLAEADASGNITATYDYAPYGSQALGTPPSGPGYTGHVNDPDTGLVYMQARYYDPTVGRFISTDPIGPIVGNTFNFNRFMYANNNPIVNMDPNGKECTGSHIMDSGGNCASTGTSLAGSGSGGVTQAKILGKVVTVSIDSRISSSNQSKIKSKINSSVSKINDTKTLTDDEKRIIRNVNSIAVDSTVQRSEIIESTGALTLTSAFVLNSSATWLASSIGHDGMHVELFDQGGISQSRGLNAEVTAMKFQERIAFKMGMTDREAGYIETLIYNPQMLKSYISINP